MSNDNDNKTTIPPAQDEEKLVAERREKLAALRARGQAFPNDFRRDALAEALHTGHGDQDNAQLEAQPRRVRVAGRMLMRRIMGKASFVHLQDMSGKIQLYVQRETLGESAYDDFKHWDIGDILGAEGVLFKTRPANSRLK